MLLRSVAIVGIVGVAVCLLSMKTSQAQGLSMTDRNFLKNAAQSGHYEVEASTEALARSEDQQVRDFAQMMIQEHEQMDKELNELAVAKDFTLPNSASMVQRSKITRLQGLEGLELDQYYAEELGTKAHEEAIELFEQQVEKGNDEEIVGFAQDALVLLRQHLQHAQSLKTHVAAKTQ